MDTFQAHYADIRDPAQHPRIAAQLRERGLVTFSDIADRAAGPDGVTVITDTHASTAGYAAFTDAELVPHTPGQAGGRSRRAAAGGRCRFQMAAQGPAQVEVGGHPLSCFHLGYSRTRLVFWEVKGR